MDIPVPQIPPMMQLQFAQSPNRNNLVAGLIKNLGAAKGAVTPAPDQPAVDPGAAVPGAVGMTAAGSPNGPQPLVTPGTVPQGPPAPSVGAPGAIGGQPSIIDAMRGMQPTQILDVLRNMSRGGQQVVPPGMPGSAALAGAGMLPSTFGG